MTSIVKILDAKREVGSYQVVKGQTLVLDAQDQVNYQLIDDKTGSGPQNIITKRVGNDLQVILEDGDLNPDIIIQGYYPDGDKQNVNSVLIGEAENGKIYAYIPKSGVTDDAVSMLDDAEQAGQALGGEEIVDGLWSYLPWWLLGLGLVGAGIALIANHSNSDSDNEIVEVSSKVDSTVTVDNDNKQVDIKGTTTNVAEGATVTVTITDSQGNTVTATTTVDKDGNYNIDDIDTSGLVDGDITVDTSTTDNNGNTITDTDPAVLDQVDSAIDSSVTVDNEHKQVDIDGTTTDVAEGATVTVIITDIQGNTVTATTTVDADGNYNIDDIDTSSLTDGEVTVDTSVTDNNGESISDTDNVTLDTTPPALTAALNSDSDSGTVGDNITNDNTPTISGTGEAGASIEVVVGGQTLITTVGDDGAWSVTAAELTDATYTATVTETDAAGNTTTTPVEVTVDTTPPAPTVSLQNDSGTYDDDKLTTDGSLALSAGEDGATITSVVAYLADSTSITVTADADGNYVLPVGVYSDVEITSTDVAGNIGTGKSGAITVAEGGDGNPGVLGSMDITLLNDTGTSEDDGVININIPEFMIRTMPNATVTITVKDSNGSVVGTYTTKTNATGSVFYTLPAELADGDYTVSVVALAGATYSGTGSKSITVDTVSALTVDVADTIDDNNVAAVAVSGKADVVDGSEVTITLKDEQGNEVTETATVTDGEYSTTAGLTALSNGPITATVSTTATDVAGNTPDNASTYSIENIDTNSVINGHDTITLTGSGSSFRLTTNVDGAEVIDIDGSGANTIYINATNVQESSSESTIYIQGGSDDTVNLGYASTLGTYLGETLSDGTTWAATGDTVTDTDGNTYNVWQYGADTTTTIYIQDTITNII